MNVWISDDDYFAYEFDLDEGSVVGAVGTLPDGRAWWSVGTATRPATGGGRLRNVREGVAQTARDAMTIVEGAIN